MGSLIKWGLAVAFITIAILTFAGKKTIRVETTIPAPPLAVWAAMMDSGNCGEWNPVFTQIEGTYKEGVMKLKAF